MSSVDSFDRLECRANLLASCIEPSINRQFQSSMHHTPGAIWGQRPQTRTGGASVLSQPTLPVQSREAVLQYEGPRLWRQRCSGVRCPSTPRRPSRDPHLRSSWALHAAESGRSRRSAGRFVVDSILIYWCHLMRAVRTDNYSNKFVNATDSIPVSTKARTFLAPGRLCYYKWQSARQYADGRDGR